MINWSAANDVPSDCAGFAQCMECRGHLKIDQFMWVNGSRSIRCLSCLDKRERDS